MTQHTRYAINVIRSLKAFWIAQPGQLEEANALRELTRALDEYEAESMRAQRIGEELASALHDYVGGDDESQHAQEAGKEPSVPRRNG